MARKESDGVGRNHSASAKEKKRWRLENDPTERNKQTRLPLTCRSRKSFQFFPLCSPDSKTNNIEAAWITWLMPRSSWPTLCAPLGRSCDDRPLVKRSDACRPPHMTLVFPAIKKISNELGGQCTKKPTAGRWGLGQMIPPDEKGTKAAEHKVRHNF